MEFWIPTQDQNLSPLQGGGSSQQHICGVRARPLVFAPWQCFHSCWFWAMVTQIPGEGLRVKDSAWLGEKVSTQQRQDIVVVDLP